MRRAIRLGFEYTREVKVILRHSSLHLRDGYRYLNISIKNVVRSIAKNMFEEILA